MSVQIFELPNQGDERGLSFSDPRWKPFLPQIKDVHLATIRPGAVRGNHYHRSRKELIYVMHGGDWSFHWEAQANGGLLEKRFHGTGCVMIAIEPGTAHAVRNDGAMDLFLFAACDADYDPTRPDAYRKEIIPQARAA